MSSVVRQNNNRIFKNTLFLYIRLLLTIIVGLYASRMILKILGVTDFGIYNVVGGVVVFMGYFNDVMSQGTTRYLTFSLGKGDRLELKKIFTACFSIHFVLAVITLILAETIGLWFLNNRMNIPEGRYYAANWVYQFAVFSAFLNVMQVPYSATIIAHEKMSIYAYMSIFDAVMKLLAVYLLFVINYDKLIVYSLFYFIVDMLSIVLYRIYCHSKFQECSFSFEYNKKIYREIFSYTGWNAVGTMAYLCNTQGINLLLNIFFGPIVNASRGLANTVNSLVNKFVLNFQVANRPQIVKYYAQSNLKEMHKLIMNSSKFSSYLLILFGIPVFIETPFLINLWLGQVPQYVVIFIRLTLILNLIQVVDYPLGTGLKAYGKMKLPNLTSCIIYLMILPITFFLLKLGYSPICSYIVHIIMYPLAMFCDLLILKRYLGFKISIFFNEVILRVLIVSILAFLFPYIASLFLNTGWHRLLIVSIVSILSTFIVVFTIGINSNNRKNIALKFKKFLQ